MKKRNTTLIGLLLLIAICFSSLTIQAQQKNLKRPTLTPKELPLNVGLEKHSTEGFVISNPSKNNSSDLNQIPIKKYFSTNKESSSKELKSDTTLKILFEENFETVTVDSSIQLEGWTNFKEVGNRAWYGKLYNLNSYAQMTSFTSGEANISWLVTPAIDLTSTIDEVFTFKVNVGYYTHTGLTILVSEDYDGSNVLSANWTDITSSFNIPTSPTTGYAGIAPAGEFDLSFYTNKVHIAFKYSGDANTVQTTTYQVDNVRVSGKIISELLTNPGFDNIEGIMGFFTGNEWGSWTDNGGVIEVVEGIVQASPVVDIENWKLQLAQLNFPIENQKNYKIKFDAWADADRVICLAIEDTINSYQILGSSQSEGSYEGRSKWDINITSTPTTYELFMTVDAMQSNSIPKLGFLLSQSGEKVYIDNVSLQQVSSDFIINGGFEDAVLGSNTATNWQFLVYDECTAVFTIVSDAHSGNHALQADVSLSGIAQNNSVQAQHYPPSIAFEKTAMYQMRFWAKSSAPNQLHVMLNKPNWEYVNGIVVPSLSGDWQEYTFDFFAQTNDTLLIQTWFQSNGSYWIEDFEIVELYSTVNLTFHVDMSRPINRGEFVVGTDFVYVTGSYNGWDEPGTGESFILDDLEDDQIYSGIVRVAENFGELQYKYFINTTWAHGDQVTGNRTITIGENDYVIDPPDIWFNPEKPISTLTKATTTPVIDGVEDDVWSNNVTNYMDKSFFNENPSVNVSGSSYWKGLWTDDGIYIFVQVYDDTFLPAYAGAVPANNWEYDKIEIYFDVNEVLEDGVGSIEYQGHYQFAPAFEQSLIDGTPFSYAGTTVAYKVNNPSYAAEVFIPFSKLLDKDGLPLDITDSIGFDVTIVDRDMEETPQQRAIWANNGFIQENYFNMDEAGIILLNSGIESVTVTFNVDMSRPIHSGYFVTSTDVVYVTGNFANANNPDIGWDEPGSGESLLMDDSDGDQVYTASVMVPKNYGELKYKYFKNTGFENGDNITGDRTIIIGETDFVVHPPDIWLVPSTILWSEDFDGARWSGTVMQDGNGYLLNPSATLPGDANGLGQWSIIDNNALNYFWHWSDVGPRGAYTRGTDNDWSTPDNNILSALPEGTTISNGVMMLESDYFNTTEAGVISSNVIDMDAILQFGPINMSSATGGIFNMKTIYRTCCSWDRLLGLAIGIPDGTGGITWSDEIALNLLTPNNSYTYAEERDIKVNISRVSAGASFIEMAGQPEVYIRLHKTLASHYFWIIDDIKIYEPPVNDLIVEDTWYDYMYNSLEAGYEQSSDASFNFWGGYTQIPQSVVAPFVQFRTAVNNNGTNDAIDAKVDIQIDKNGTQVYSTASEIKTIEKYLRDTLYATANYTPSGPGNYKINLNVNMMDSDEAPENNSDSYKFSVTNDLYSRVTPGGESSFTAAGPRDWASGGFDGDVLAQPYDFPSTIEFVTLKSVKVLIAFPYSDDETTAIESGAFAMKARIYKIDEAGEIVDAGIASDLYTLQISDTGFWVTLDLLDEGNLVIPGGQTYYAGIETFTGSTDQSLRFQIGADPFAPKQPSQGGLIYMTSQGNWYVTGDNYAIDLQLDVSEITDFPIDFETGTYIFDSWGTVTSSVVANPLQNGSNGSAQVAQMIKNSGGLVWDGSRLLLKNYLDFSTNKYFSMKVLSPRVGVPIIFKAQDLNNTVVFEKWSYTTVANEWETLYFNFTGAQSGAMNYLTFFFDAENFGDGSSNSTYYFDDIEFTSTNPNQVVVTFNVDMTDQITLGTFIPGSDVVYLTGSFNGWDEPGTGESILLTDTDGDNIYKGGFTIPSNSGEVQYKYFINTTWANGEWTGEPNRKVTIGTTDITLNDTYGVLENVPTITSLEVSNITSNTATLSGEVNANSLSTQVVFEYGTTTAVSQSINATPFTITGTQNTAVQAQLNGLQPKTLYYYRVKAVNSLGTVYSGIKSFNTQSSTFELIISGSTSVCAGASNIAYSIPNESYNSINWDVTNGSITNGQGTNTILVTWNKTGSSGTVNVEATNSDGLEGSNSITVTFNGGSISKPGHYIKSPGKANILICTSPGFSYQWYKNNVVISDAKGQKQFYVARTDIGTYQVQITDNFGCTSLSDIIEVGNNKSLNLYPNPAKQSTTLSYESDATGILTLRIVNVFGKTLRQTDLNKEQYQIQTDIPLPDLEKGVYMIEILLDGIWVESEQLIIN